MNEHKKNTITITVDIKRHRIRIYKATLQSLDYPKYVQLLVNPQTMMIAIKGMDKKTRDSHRVNLSVLQCDNLYELYSKQLVEKLCALMQGLDINYNYKLFGEVISEPNIAVFPLSTMRKIEYWESVT